MIFKKVHIKFLLLPSWIPLSSFFLPLVMEVSKSLLVPELLIHCFETRAVKLIILAPQKTQHTHYAIYFIFYVYSFSIIRKREWSLKFALQFISSSFSSKFSTFSILLRNFRNLILVLGRTEGNIFEVLKKFFLYSNNRTQSKLQVCSRKRNFKEIFLTSDTSNCNQWKSILADYVISITDKAIHI